MFRKSPMALALALALFASPVALGQSIADEADQHFKLGAAAYDAFDYKAALLHFMQSNRLSPNAITAGNVGHTFVAMNKFPEAYRWYAVALSLSEGENTSIERSMKSIEKNVVLVNLTSDPDGATVYVDQKSLGAVATTPATIALPKGEYTFIIETEGHRTYTSEKVALNQLGKSVDIEGKLSPVTGTLVVNGEDGVEVRLGSEDGDLLCETPCKTEVPIGQRIVYFREPGYRSQPALLDVKEGEVSEIEPVLIEITGSLSVAATERGALVEIDGVAVGFTPTVAPTVQVGPHTVRVTREGFEPYEIEVDIEEGEQLDLGRVLLVPSFTVSAASRSAQSVSEAPASVTLIPAEEIRAFGYQSVYEAVAGARGIYQTDDFQYSGTGFRGFARLGDYGNRILTTIDGHVLNENQSGSSFSGDEALSDLRDVKQIELVRGPGSALYGSNALFGVINMVMRDGSTENRPHVSATATDGLIRGRLSGGVGNEDVGGWLTVSGLWGQGDEFYFEEYEDEPRTGGFSRGADKTSGTTISGKAWAGDFVLSAHYMGREKQIPNGAYATLLADPRSRSNDFRGFGELAYIKDLENTSLDIRASVDAYRYFGVFPYGRSYNYIDIYDGAWATVEPRVVQRFGETADVTVGLVTGQHFRAVMVSEERETPKGEAFSTPLDTNPKYQTYSAYAVADIHPGDLVRFNIGGRFDQFNTLSENFTTFNPRAALIITPGDEVVKLLAGTAFRAPSMYEFFYTDGGISSILPDDLRPERITTLEAEWTHQFDDVLTATGSGYYNQIGSLIDTRDVGGGVAQFFNVGEPTRTIGAEAEVRRAWRSGWMLAGQVSYQRTRIGTLGEEGIELTNSPVLLSSAMGAIPLGGQMTLAQKIRAESPRLTKSGGNTPWALIWDVTLTGQLAEPNIEYGLGVRNLLDWEVLHPGGPDSRQDVVPQRGRDLFATVTFGF